MKLAYASHAARIARAYLSSVIHVYARWVRSQFLSHMHFNNRGSYYSGPGRNEMRARSSTLVVCVAENS
jgi:hypothetical protein